MLYKHMEMEDIYDLYDGKFGVASDTQSFVDIELVFGLNKDKTKSFLQKLPKDGFTFSAVPPKIKGVGTFPVRAFATINK